MSAHANDKIFREYPWMWAVCRGYSTILHVRIKDLEDELERPAFESHWLIIDMGNKWIVEQIPDSLAMLGYSLAQRMVAHMKVFLDSLPAERHARIAYIVRRSDDRSYTILRPRTGMTVLQDAQRLAS